MQSLFKAFGHKKTVYGGIVYVFGNNGVLKYHSGAHGFLPVRYHIANAVDNVTQAALQVPRNSYQMRDNLLADLLPTCMFTKHLQAQSNALFRQSGLWVHIPKLSERQINTGPQAHDNVLDFSLYWTFDKGTAVTL